MLVIFSNRDENHSNELIVLLTRANIPFYRLNSEDLSDIDYVDFSENIIYFKHNKPLNLNDCTIAWYRKWGTYELKKFNNSTLLNNFDYFNTLYNEFESLSNYIFNVLEFNKIRWISNPLYVNFNDKMFNLFLAKKLNINVPNYRLSSKYIFEGREQVTKPMFEAQAYSYNDFTYKSFTHKLKNTYEHVFPSFTQDCVNCLFEVRILYFNRECYATAFYHKNIDELETDIKDIKYNMLINNGQIETNIFTIEVGAELKNKIINFMKIKKLNYGALDFLYDKEGKYWFLEMNPVGQFLGYSKSGYHNLSYIIFSYILKNIK